MKKFSVFFFVLLPVLCFAQQKNNISMVTYFPVPYVSYSNVNVAQQMDIGLTSQECQLELGSSSMPNSTRALNVVNTNGTTPGQFIMKSGTLNLEAPEGTTLAITKQTVPSVEIGGGSSTNREGAQLLFNKVYIPQISNSYSMNSNTMYVSGTLKLFGLTGSTTQKTFPSCKTAYSGSSGKMEWAEIALGKSTTKSVYLTCGGVLGCEESTRPTQPRACTLQDVLTLANSPETGHEFRAQFGSYLTYVSWQGAAPGRFITRATGLVDPMTMGVCGQAIPTPSCNCNSEPCTWTNDEDLSHCIVYESPHTPLSARIKSCSAALGSTEWRGWAVRREYTTCNQGMGTSSLRWDYEPCMHWRTYEDWGAATNGECSIQLMPIVPSCNLISHKGNSYTTRETRSTMPCMHANPLHCKKCVPIRHKCWNYGTEPAFP